MTYNDVSFNLPEVSFFDKFYPKLLFLSQGEAAWEEYFRSKGKKCAQVGTSIPSHPRSYEVGFLLFLCFVVSVIIVLFLNSGFATVS